MIVLSGNVAEFFVGYKLAVTLTRWQLTRGPDALGSIKAIGAGVVQNIDFLYVVHPVTKATFKLGNNWWIWRSAELKTDGLYLGGTANFQVFGDPEIREGFNATESVSHA